MFSRTNKILNGIETRFRRARPGSVLIIVIVLLLLLAILGAAYISTTRSARVASAQNVQNADVNNMINGIAKVCEGIIMDDVNDTFGNLRGNTLNGTGGITNRSYYQGPAGAALQIFPNPIATPGTAFNPGDIVNDTGDAQNPYGFYELPSGSGTSAGLDVALVSPPWVRTTSNLPITAIGANAWLADRVPNPAGTVVGGGQPPFWTGLTQGIVSGSAPGTYNAVSILGTSFIDPTTGNAITGLTTLVGGLGPNLTSLRPDSIPLNNGLNTPALATPAAGASFTKYGAGNADGSGIADSFMFQIPGPSYGGLTWLAAVRIIDNNSAINANTALSRDTLTFTSGGQDVWNAFPSSVGLQEIVNTSDAAGMTAIQTYRYGGSATASAQPADESEVSGNTAPNAVARNDFTFSSPQEAYYNQLVRRMANPGYNGVGGPRYQPLPLSEEAALAFHGCLQNPNSMYQSALETLLPYSLCGVPAASLPSTSAIPSTPYDASNGTSWYEHNYTYSTTSDPVYSLNASSLASTLRPILVTHDPVSNCIQQVYNNGPAANGGAGATSSDPILPNYMLPYGVNTTSGANPHFRGIWSSTGSYNPNDIVVYPGGGTVVSGNIYIGPNYTFILASTTAPGYSASNPPATFNSNNVMTAVAPGWQLQSWTSNPVKANVNTATFPELFRAFWCVMAGNPSCNTPFGVTGVDNYLIYDATAPTASVNTTGNPQCMFRSPLRDPTAAVGTSAVSLLDAPAGGNVTNTNTMLLRAALAAVNTIGLRDNTQNVISRTIILNKPSQINNAGAAATGTVELQVYSNAPQPVISEVFASTFNQPDSNTTLTNAQGYVAVELYNPYSVPLTLTNWQLGLINRSSTGSTYPNLCFETSPQAAGTPPVTPAGAVSWIGGMYPMNNPIPDPKNGNAYDLPVAANVINIPAHGYALLENFNPTGSPVTVRTTNDALCRPVAALSQLPTPGTGSLYAGAVADQMQIWYGPGGAGAPTVCDVYVPNLQLVMQGTAGVTTAGGSITTSSPGGELVVLRPRRYDGTYTSSGDPTNTYNEGSTTAPNLNDLVPVDSYDFTGLVIPAPGNTTGPWPVWSYIRPKSNTVASLYFEQFFPGFYHTAATPREGGVGVIQGTDAEQIKTVATQTVTWTNATATPCIGVDSASGSYSIEFPPIQICNVAAGDANGDVMHFPNAVVSAQNPYPAGITPVGGAYQFPYGGFARNGDMLDIPFVGSYRIRISSSSTLASQVGSSAFLELNALPKDCSLAAVETSNPAQDGGENIGRFMPMAASWQYVKLMAANVNPTPNYPDYYSWTRNLFNYLTVQSSNDAYLPNFDPNYASSPAAVGTFAYPPQNAAAPISPTPTLTGNATAYDRTLQDNVGVEGLININTAPWKVLSMLPFASPLGPGGLAAAQAADRQIAQNIVNYRLYYGPFMSIYDLNQVPGFQSGTAVTWTPTPATGLPAPATPTAPSSALGLMSPADPNFGTTTPPSATPTGIAEDYQWDCLTLSRISNLVTTRSDTFTVYIEVQGWQNIGQKNAAGAYTAQPLVTRHYAFIVDRSAVNGDPSTRFLKTLAVPND